MRKVNADSVELGKVDIGGEIHYRIELTGFDLTLTVNGQTVKHSYDWAKDNNHVVRFRAGAYCFEGASDDGCEARFSYLKTSHSWAPSPTRVAMTTLV